MKSSTTKLVSLVTLISISSMCLAVVTPYVGYEYQWRTTNLRGLGKYFPRNTPSSSFTGGLRFNSRMGLMSAEVSGNFIKKNKDDFSRSVRSKGLSVSLLKYWSLRDDNKINLLASAGFAHIKHTYRGMVDNKLFTKFGQIRYHRISPRFMLGTEIYLMDRMNLRVSAIWESAYSLKQKIHKIHPNYGLSSGLVVTF